MRTTQIIIEHLIAGIQMLVWLLIFVSSVVGIDWAFALRTNFNLALLAVPLLAFVYPMGIIVDNIADRLLKIFEKRIRKGIPDGQKSITNLLIKMNNPAVEAQFDYIRTRIRISRSAALNFLLIAIATIIFAMRQLEGNNRLDVIWITIVMGGFLFAVSMFSWRILTKSFYAKLAKRYAYLDEI